MRALLLALLATTAAATAATTAQAETDVSALIAAEGVAGAEAALAALPVPTPSERLGLGGVRLLAGVERALQLRHRVGMTDALTMVTGIPILRLPVADNPAPEPFEPAMVEALFEGVEADMAGALDALAGIADADEAAVEIDLADLWLDVDADGARGPGEDLLAILASVATGGFGEPLPAVTVRFDTADAAWMSAYAHLLSALSEAVLAVEPTPAIAHVLAGRDAMAAYPAPVDPYGMGSFAPTVDAAAMAVLAIEGRPDPGHLAAARDHALAVIADNRRFWELVAREADDDAEWIPNKRQASATGLPFPPDTGARWLAVLAEAEAVIRGDRLIPFWRVGNGAGLDLAALLADPPDLTLAGLVSGADLAPYLRQGPVARGESLQAFAAMMRGDAALYMVMLN